MKKIELWRVNSESLSRRTRVIAVCLALAAGNSFAIQIGTTWSEDGNAGRTVATAQDTTGAGLPTAINGRYASPDDVDFFKIVLAAGNFSANTYANGISLEDTMLFLWDSAGNPLLFNDDVNPFSYSSEISGFILTPGTYILGISAANGGWLHLADEDFDGDELDSPDAYYPVQYSIVLSSGSSVPDSGATWFLLGLSAIGLAAIRRKTTAV